MCFLFPLLSEQSLGSATTLVSAWKTNLFYRLETFVPIRKTNLSPVERFVSIPKQTPDCIPTASMGRCQLFFTDAPRRCIRPEVEKKKTDAGNLHRFVCKRWSTLAFSHQNWLYNHPATLVNHPILVDDSPVYKRRALVNGNFRILKMEVLYHIFGHMLLGNSLT